MEKNTSIYLDLVRFIAACLVVIYHACGEGITGGFLWQLSGYGHPAVIVFFVLSGYVIGFVSNTKEKTLWEYSVARVSRLYSIILPALIITLLCNEVGSHYISADYNGPWNENGKYTYARYIASIFMLQNVWSADLVPTNNGSFWSLSYEFFYYVLFAGVYYLKGVSRLLVIMVAVIIAGPKIVALAPIWGLGYFAFQINTSNRIILPSYLSMLFFMFGLTALALCPYYVNSINFSVPYIGESIASDYLVGFVFFIHLLGVPYVAKRISYFLCRVNSTVAFASSLTFAIYLFHLPLIRLFAGISPFIEDSGSWQNILFVYLATFSIISLVGIPAERSKRWYKHFILGRYEKIRLTHI